MDAGIRPEFDEPEPVVARADAVPSAHTRIVVLGPSDVPINGARIELWRLDSHGDVLRLATQSDGSASREGIVAGVYNLVVSAAGYGCELRRAELPGGLTIRLKSGCSVKVRLVDFERGRWTGASLLVAGVGGRESSFACTEKLLDLGSHGPGSLEWKVVAPPHVVVPLRALLLPEGGEIVIPLLPVRIGGLHVRVLSSETGTPVEGCSFAVSNSPSDLEDSRIVSAGPADDFGYREIQANFSKGGQLRVSAQGFAVAMTPVATLAEGDRRSVEVRLGQPASIRIDPGETKLAELEAYVGSDAAHGGRVLPILRIASVARPGQTAVWRRNGCSFPGASRAPSSPVEAQTGLWEVTGLPAEVDVALVAIAADGVQVQQIIRTGPPSSESTWKISWPDVHALRVRVLSGRAGSPVAGARVNVYENGGVPAAAITDEAGYARFLGIARGATFEIEALQRGQRVRETLDLEEALRTGEFELAFESAARREPMTVVVTDELGRAVADAVVQWRGPTSSPGFTATDTRGVAHATRQVGSPAGLWIWKYGHRPVQTAYGELVPDSVVLRRVAALAITMVSASEDLDLSIELYRGTKQDGDGSPFGSASGLLRAERSLRVRLLRGEGQLLFEDLDPGEYRLLVSRESGTRDPELLSSAAYSVESGLRTRARIVIP